MTKRYWIQTLAYACLALPAAFCEQPLYLHLPKYYAGNFGISLTLIGPLLMLARIADGLSNFWLGRLADRFVRQPSDRTYWVLTALIPLGFCLFFLFNPWIAAHFSIPITMWLVVGLLCTHICESALSIGYQALGSEIATTYHQRTNLTATREMFRLSGCAVGSVVPCFFAAAFLPSQLFWYWSLLFIGLMVLCGSFFYKQSARPQASQIDAKLSSKEIKKWLKIPQLRQIYGVFLVNSIAVSITGGMFLFFVDYRLKLNSYMGYFLIIYFLSTIISLPFWRWLSNYFSKHRTWAAAAFSAAVCLVYMLILKEGAVWQFGVVCFLYGFCLGADSAFAGSIAADVINKHTLSSGVFFSFWNIISKFSTAFGPAIVLFVLGMFADQYGYKDSRTLWALSLLYAGLPALLKIATSIWLCAKIQASVK